MPNDCLVSNVFAWFYLGFCWVVAEASCQGSVIHYDASEPRWAGMSSDGVCRLMDPQLSVDIRVAI